MRRGVRINKLIEPAPTYNRQIPLAKIVERPTHPSNPAFKPRTYGFIFSRRPTVHDTLAARMRSDRIS